ncbi:MAG: threonine synthase [Clostridia bacterium]|nr:threonine synthase [Clostridia bacterium]
MKYISTRGLCEPADAPSAILEGLAPDGGLFVPEEIPVFTEEEKEALRGMEYRDTALLVLRKYLDSLPEERLKTAIRDAYDSFEGGEPAPVRMLRQDFGVMELWHGPTCAFKDIALQLMPRLMSICRDITGLKEVLEILVATSGDTGKAALEGFKDVPGTAVTVFYPENGVSAVQKAQMVTQQGSNVQVYAVKGNFDDAQTGVKAIFTDRELAESRARQGRVFSSANSINWGRLLPQVVYYVKAAFGLAPKGGTVDFTVPTGNFGDILAGFYARRMGAPVGRLVCASNSNDVLTQFICTGVYDRRREFYRTISPSMDILVSSNLERLLYLAGNGDSAAVREYMESLRTQGFYTVSPETLENIRSVFDACSCTDEEALAVIGDVYMRHGYLMDPHTAVGMYAARRFAVPGRPMVLVSTASPFKFAESVLRALGAGEAEGFEALDKLSSLTGLAVPARLDAVRRLPVRFRDCVTPGEMKGLFR